MTNRVDPDQTQRSVASDLDLHCLFKPGQCPGAMTVSDLYGSASLIYQIICRKTWSEN